MPLLDDLPQRSDEYTHLLYTRAAASLNPTITQRNTLIVAGIYIIIIAILW
jgi:hypothetical protein